MGAEKVAKYLGHFWYKVCSQELSKIAQSGHTAAGATENLVLLGPRR